VSEMLFCGGSIRDIFDTSTSDRYNPGSESWTTATNAFAPRASHTAVWTGSEMIVWGGVGIVGQYFNSGVRYSPGTDTWTATSYTNAPAARTDHTAVWTGSEMIVWRGRGEP